MKRKIAGFSIMLLGAVLSSGCYTYESEPVTATAINLNTEEAGVQDSIFVREALRGAWKQIEIARSGVTHAHNPDIKLLAQRIVDDRSSANADLKLIAWQQNVPVAPPSNLTDDSYPYRNLTGEKFDQVFIRQILQSQPDEIRRFKTISRNARNSDVRDFAGRNLPVLEEHLRIAQNIERMAAMNININEPAGAQASTEIRDPFFGGDLRRPHQFNELSQPSEISAPPSVQVSPLPGD